MKVALDGPTGFIGSHVLTALREHDHEVVALVRDAPRPRSSRPAAPRQSCRPLRSSGGREPAERADGAIHTASPGDATSADLDSAVVDAAIDAFAGTGKPYIRSAVCGSTGPTPRSPRSHRSIRRRCGVEGADRAPSARASDMRGVVIVSGTAYGDGGGGIPGLLLGSPRDDDGNLIMLGTGSQHWATVHAADLADVFRRVLEDDSASGRYVVGNGLDSTLAELTEAAAVAAGAAGAVPGSDDEARARLGTTSRKSYCKIRAPTRPELEPSSVGPHPIRDLSTSSARGVTAK